MTAVTEPAVAAKAQVGAPDSSSERPSARAWYAMFALIVTMLFAFVTRQILTLLAGPIKADLSLTDLQIGETHGLTPAIFALIIMYPMAWLADRFERRTVMFGAVLFWSAATAASGLAVDFLTLQACTVALVMGEAALSPLVYSLIADLFPEKYRPRANIIAYGATALGAGLGLALGGLLIGVVDDVRVLLPESLSQLAAWRLAFFLVAVPGPIVAVAVFLIGPTKRMAAKAKAEANTEAKPAPAPMAPIMPYIREHGLVALGVFGTMALFNFALQGFGTWMPIVFVRIFGVEPAEAGIRFGLTFMAGALVGLFCATLLTPIYRRMAGTAFVLRAISLAAAGAAVPMFLFAFATALWQAYALLFCLTVVFITGVALMPGMMQDVSPPTLRTRVIALGTVIYMMAGAVSSPLVGFISDQASDNPRGLLLAIVGVAVTGFLACAVLARLMEPSYKRTVAAVAEG